METNTTQIEEEGPEGIGGWLILVVIGLILSIIRIGFSIFSDLIPLLNVLDSTPGLIWLRPLIYLELTFNSFFCLYAVLLLILMFNYSRLFPLLIIIFYISHLVFVIVDHIIVSQNPVLSQFELGEDAIKEIIKSLAGAAIWVPYMILSKRVKNTFTY